MAAPRLLPRATRHRRTLPPRSNFPTHMGFLLSGNDASRAYALEVADSTLRNSTDSGSPPVTGPTAPVTALGQTFAFNASKSGSTSPLFLSRPVPAFRPFPLTTSTSSTPSCLQSAALPLLQRPLYFNSERSVSAPQAGE